MKRKLKELSRREICVIAMEYSSTSNEKSGDYFSKRYNISTATFYNVLHKAILESIVNEKIARIIAKKAAYNNQIHGGEAAKRRTLSMYEELIKESKYHRLGRDEAKKWVTLYIESDLNIDDFSKENCIEVILLKRALYDAIIYSWIDDEKVNMLKEKTKKYKAEGVEISFEKILEKRYKK